MGTFNDLSRQEPDERLCPGDTIITRTWTIVDDCGNVFTRDQIITITLPVGECIPTACPPCDDVQCCESSLAPVPCNPVGCNAVPCIATTCQSVPCLPSCAVEAALCLCPCLFLEFLCPFLTPFLCPFLLVPCLWLLLLLASPSTSTFSMMMRILPLSLSP